MANRYVVYVRTTESVWRFEQGYCPTGNEKFLVPDKPAHICSRYRPRSINYAGDGEVAALSFDGEYEDAF